MRMLTDDYITSLKPACKEVDDLERCLYVLQAWQKKEPNSNPYTWLKSHMVRPPAVDWVEEHLLPKMNVTIMPKEKPEKRKDKYAKLEKLALEKTFHEFTTQELVDESGLGAQTITKWAKTTGFFRSTDKGKWEARNPKEDRKSNG